MNDTQTSATWRSALRALLRALQSLRARFRHHVQQPVVGSPAPRTVPFKYVCSCGLVYYTTIDIVAHINDLDPPAAAKLTYKHYIAAIYAKHDQVRGRADTESVRQTDAVNRTAD